MNFKNNTDTLDQHFLVSETVINKFIEFCDLKKSDVCLEIGPGRGVLTKLIAPNVRKLTVIEKDERLEAYLKEIPNIDVIIGDAIYVSWPKVNKIITSIPYSIIEPFIKKLTKEDFDELVMMMGKNYCMSVLDKKITYLSLMTNVFFKVEKIIDVPKEAFKPEPRVMSSLVRIRPKKCLTKIDELFQNIYNLDHKKCKNAIIESLIIRDNITQKEAKAVLNNMNIDDNILNKPFSLIKNEELEVLYNKLLQNN